MITVEPGVERDAYLPLFLLADDSESQVRAYYQTGELYVLTEGAIPLGIVLVMLSGAEAELKSVAVIPQRHNQGIGKRLVAAVLNRLDLRGVRRVVVATGNSSIGELAFYQKLGFRPFGIDPDFFSHQRGYPPALQENGIPLRDRILLERTR